MPGRDPFESFGVPRGATGDVVRKAYRRISREHHPDANPDDPAAEERFEEIQQAHELLSDPEKRRTFDDEKRPSRPSSRRKRAGHTTGSVNLADLIAKRVNVSGLQPGGHRKVEWWLGGADLARISRVLDVDMPASRSSRASASR